MMMCIGYKSSWGVEMRKNQQRKDTLVEDVQRPTPSPSQLVFRVLFTSSNILPRFTVLDVIIKKYMYFRYYGKI